MAGPGRGGLGVERDSIAGTLADTDDSRLTEEIGVVGMGLAEPTRASNEIGK